MQDSVPRNHSAGELAIAILATGKLVYGTPERRSERLPQQTSIVSSHKDRRFMLRIAHQQD